MSKKPKRYYLTRKTKKYVWVRWEFYGSQRRGLSNCKTLEEFENNWEKVSENPPLYSRKV